ncbi:MAG: PAS domain S-box protein, partial [Cyanobacteria bacterium J083]
LLASALAERYKSWLEGKKTLSYEEYFILAGENTCWLTNLHPLATSTGRIYRIIATSLNITQRKIAETELDREKKFLQALLDNLSDGIVACDKEGILTLFNQASKDFHGLPQQAIPAEEWAKYYDLYLPDGKTLMPQAEIPLFCALQGKSVRDVEMMIIPQNGEPRTLLANGDPIIDSKGEKIGAIVAMRDITERKQAQQALAQINAQLNQELEQRVEERTAQLKQLNTMLLAATTTLEKRNQELDQFAYVASHDLKAPLRAIANLSAWIEEDLEDKLDEDTRHKMNLLRGRVHRLENLINGLLTYSRVGRLKSTPQEVDVQVMLGEIINSLDIPANFTINILGEMPTLVTELLPLQQVFTNLLSNAIKHSECGDDGKITIAVKELDDYYEFTVSDNGKGIEPQYHERIFTVFQTLEARDTKESTGIGLAIVKKAVENQGGKITIESEVG